ncbi:hypothetical protein PPTG_18362 [Phytophthora nicotianae INRA-310]|uniref:Uncharacterized protein n=1 Tax=Phytophthora nicotianae (strain INRA-310) TaxID=761204 RepID=W2PIB5_PHYN3|nr:hypothetical protein PPTG_18362 [Phytophthora nicotianae INRA-310]ETM99973.1 hypothetical protein PPTG_18362 [Phytophthora nicotianae INRA-310]
MGLLLLDIGGSAMAARALRTRWLWENRPEGCTTAAEDAAAHGRLDVVRYLDSCGTNCTDAAMDTATSSGHLQVTE